MVRLCRRLLTASVLLSVLVYAALAQPAVEGFVQYRDCSVPAPRGSTRITADELVLTDAFIEMYPQGIPVATQQELRRLYQFYRNHPDGRREWEIMQKLAVTMISSWDISKGGGMDRYIYKVANLRQLSLLYIFTGHPLLSSFIRAHLDKMASLPVDFWVHAELRGCDPSNPEGALETAIINKTLGYALSAVRRDMSPDEFDRIERAWYERGHSTALNWVRHHRLKSNWTAVIGAGLYNSACWFGDGTAKAEAVDAMRYYLDNCIESDGSCAEGYDYFAYPVGELARAALLMSGDEMRAAFGDGPLAGSERWRIYGQIFNTTSEGDPGVMRINYGDNPYGNLSLKGPDLPGCFIKYACRDGVAAWLRDKYHCRQSMEEVLLSGRIGGEPVLPVSPQMAGMPLVKAFDNGDCYMRDGWDNGAKVLALKAGDGGSRVNGSHCRPEFNSIALAAYGEYIIVQCGSASYRSRLHYEYDICTRSANTVIIDGRNQLFPKAAAVSPGKWDNSDVWEQGYPSAVVTRAEELPDGGAILRSDAARSYHIDMEEASRTVRFVPDGGFYIMHDRLRPSDGRQHHFDYLLHIFNRDGKTYVVGKDASLHIERGKADLYISMDSNVRMKMKKRDAYLHHPVGRDYDADGPKQGKPGSAIELDWSADSGSLEVTAVLYPVPAGSKAPKIVFRGGKVEVNGVIYDIPE